MTTVREVRIGLAVEVINEQIAFGVLQIPDEPKRRARIGVAAEALVDALFPDHTLDDVEVPSSPRLRGH